MSKHSDKTDQDLRHFAMTSLNRGFDHKVPYTDNDMHNSVNKAKKLVKKALREVKVAQDCYIRTSGLGGLPTFGMTELRYAENNLKLSLHNLNGNK